MRNYWLEEIRIKEVVVLLTKLLNDEFKGEMPDPKGWMSVIEDILDALYCGDIVILDGLIRYEINCIVDEFGLVEKLELIERD